jgi:hypothetical protein
MVAGNQPSQAAVNAIAGGLVTGLRDLMTQVTNFNAWLNSAGGATALEALGFDAADAATIISTIANHATLATVYQGTASQAQPFNYMANGEALWGGQ